MSFQTEIERDNIEQKRTSIKFTTTSKNCEKKRTAIGKSLKDYETPSTSEVVDARDERSQSGELAKDNAKIPEDGLSSTAGPST